MNRQIKVAVGLSGGVDSSVAAALLKEAGFEVVGFHMHLWSDSDRDRDLPACPSGRRAGRQVLRKRDGDRIITRLCEDLDSENRCCGGELLASARKMALTLGIPFYEVDLRDWFYKEVVEYFLKEIKKGRTPNPCVVCNEKVKFGKMLEIVREQLGCEFLATGHYARVARKFQISNDKFQIDKSDNREENCFLLQAKDKSKDQSYFLYRLTQEQLAHVIFPLGDLTKKEVRKLAKKFKLPTAETPESMEICFIGNSYEEFLKKYALVVARPGKVVTSNGLVLGEHRGLGFYTIGQRGGWEQKFPISNFQAPNYNYCSSKRSVSRTDSDKTSRLVPRQVFDREGSDRIGSGLARRIKTDPDLFGENRKPLYVVGKDVASNILIVGKRKEAMRQRFEIEKVRWQMANGEIFVKIRSQGELYSCKLSPCGRSVKDRQIINSERLRVVLDKPVFGVTPGQAAVFYRKATSCQPSSRAQVFDSEDFDGELSRTVAQTRGAEGLPVASYEVVGGGIIR